MNILVDADACPRLVRTVLCNAASNRKVQTYFFANHFFTLPKSPFIHYRQVPAGFDVADNVIVAAAESADMVITNDIPLASALIEKHASVFVLATHGEIFHKENIAHRLRQRDFAQSMRDDYGLQTNSKPVYSQVDLKRFSDALDRELTKRLAK